MQGSSRSDLTGNLQTSDLAYWFLSSPYSRYPYGRTAAYLAVIRARALLIRSGVRVFSPIIHSHPVAELGNLKDMDNSFWYESEGPMMRNACGMIELHLVGWEQSEGMMYEREYFTSMNRPIEIMLPDVLPEFNHVA